MTKKLHIIYIPGLGRGDYTGQRRAVKAWQRYGVTTELFPANWSDSEPWEDKLKHLLALIDEAAADSSVALVGVSAGASAVINAFAARRKVIIGCVLIAGKVNNPQTISPHHNQDNPAFVTSVHECAEALKTLSSTDRQRILSRYGFRDMRVLTSDSRVEGAHNRRVLAFGHFWTIASQLIFGAPSFIRFLKRQTSL